MFSHGGSLMATIDFGHISDSNPDGGTTTTASVPDCGQLPDLPSAMAEEFSEAAVEGVKPDWGPTVKVHGYQTVVRVRLDTHAFHIGRSIWLLYVPTRREWVCWVCHFYYVAYASNLGDYYLEGPYKAPNHFFRKILQAYEVPVDPAWRTATVLRLAETAEEERHLVKGNLDLARLGVLADALEEAGCTSAQILGHLRGPGPHTPGCWAVDLVLGKK
jgi:hypothetical protein